MGGADASPDVTRDLTPAVVDGTIDPIRDADEVERFWRKVVRGPGSSCWFWTGAIGDDGYGNFAIRRGALDSEGGQPLVDPATGRPVVRELCVSAPRFALAAVHGLSVLGDYVAEHEVCDEPICVRAHAGMVDGGLAHVVVSTQKENLATMGRRQRGGGSPRPWQARGTSRAEKVARSRALRDVVREHGWDSQLIADALSALVESGGQGRLF